MNIYLPGRRARNRNLWGKHTRTETRTHTRMCKTWTGKPRWQGNMTEKHMNFEKELTALGLPAVVAKWSGHQPGNHEVPGSMPRIDPWLQLSFLGKKLGKKRTLAPAVKPKDIVISAVVWQGTAEKQPLADAVFPGKITFGKKTLSAWNQSSSRCSTWHICDWTINFWSCFGSTRRNWFIVQLGNASYFAPCFVRWLDLQASHAHCAVTQHLNTYHGTYHVLKVVNKSEYIARRFGGKFPHKYIFDFSQFSFLVRVSVQFIDRKSVLHVHSLS